MTIETTRLLLRPWRETDAEALYPLARDARVGPVAGWPVHTSIENSREIIQKFLSADETYAVVLRATGAVVGSIGLMFSAASNLARSPDEGELGYWIGAEFWGQGLIPEAAQALLRRGFAELNLQTIWCGYYDGNEKSKRVQRKCGFQYDRTSYDEPCPQMGDTRTEHVTRLTRAQWERTAR